MIPILIGREKVGWFFLGLAKVIPADAGNSLKQHLGDSIAYGSSPW